MYGCWQKILKRNTENTTCWRHHDIYKTWEVAQQILSCLEDTCLIPGEHSSFQKLIAIWAVLFITACSVMREIELFIKLRGYHNMTEAPVRGIWQSEMEGMKWWANIKTKHVTENWRLRQILNICCGPTVTCWTPYSCQCLWKLPRSF